MQTGVFARKIGMTQIFDDYSTKIPVTIVKVEQCQVNQVKTIKSDGYNAVQLAYGNVKVGNVPTGTNASPLNIKRNKSAPFGEFRVRNPEEYQLGQIIKLDTFFIGQKVRISGKSIGRGFAGNQKRWNFSRGLMTHGSKNHKRPGSIGAGTTPGRVYPGKKMAGQLGGGIISLRSIEVLFVNSKNGILALKGPIPGKKNTILKIQPQAFQKLNKISC